MKHKHARPAQPELYQLRLERIINHAKLESPMVRIPPIAVSEFSMVISAYYGGRGKAARYLLFEAMRLWCSDKRWSFLIWLTDRFGWTKVYHIPATPEYREHSERHGRKCSGSPNCSNMNCIDDSIPSWFKWLVRWKY
jgi:hypothetical protein